jgi:hypothetical protein
LPSALLSFRTVCPSVDEEIHAYACTQGHHKKKKLGRADKSRNAPKTNHTRKEIANYGYRDIVGFSGGVSESLRPSVLLLRIKHRHLLPFGVSGSEMCHYLFSDPQVFGRCL